jgi:bifunctional non-homologous end joining protein LigD
VNTQREPRQSIHTACPPPRCPTRSRPLENLTTSFPELADGLGALDCQDAILDGEIIVLDKSGRPSFQLLQRRLHVGAPAKMLLTGLAARLVVFDVLHLDGQDLTALPYSERRVVLQDLHLDRVAPQLAATPTWTGIDGGEVLSAMVEMGMEGTVAKAISSPYRPGRRSRLWIKTPYRHSSHFVVGGFIPARDTPEAIGAVLVGALNAVGDLVYCCTVNIGFTERARRDLCRRLRALFVDVSPFGPSDTNMPATGTHVQWVTPEVVGRVEYRDFTGQHLRHAAWKGRVDVDASAVQLPSVK